MVEVVRIITRESRTSTTVFQYQTTGFGSTGQEGQGKSPAVPNKQESDRRTGEPTARQAGRLTCVHHSAPEVAGLNRAFRVCDLKTSSASASRQLRGSASDWNGVSITEVQLQHHRFGPRCFTESDKRRRNHRYSRVPRRVE